MRADNPKEEPQSIITAHFLTNDTLHNYQTKWLSLEYFTYFFFGSFNSNWMLCKIKISTKKWERWHGMLNTNTNTNANKHTNNCQIKSTKWKYLNLFRLVFGLCWGLSFSICVCLVDRFEWYINNISLVEFP